VHWRNEGSAGSRSHRIGDFQWFVDSHPTGNALGPRAQAPACKGNQWHCQGHLYCAQLKSWYSLGFWAIRHPWEWRDRQPTNHAPTCPRIHSTHQQQP
jgi:hypothetical protein